MCEISDDLQKIHKWLHKTYEALSKEDIERAEQLGQTLLNLLNADEETSNGIKLVALFETINSGIAHMEEHAAEFDADMADKPSTIN